MKVFHFILGKANKKRPNGVNQMVAGLAKYSVRQGAEVRVIGKAETVPEEGAVVARDGFDVIAYSRWSSALRRAVTDAVSWADIVHLHSTYALHNVWVGHLCENFRKPYVVTLHGGLSLERKRGRGLLRKTLYHRLVQRRHLAKAALIHALTEEEATEAVTFSNPRSLVVVPNGVDLEDFPAPPSRLAYSGSLRIGYLGRIAREKNAAALCEAFARVNASNQHRLLLAGPKSKEAEDILKTYSSAGVEMVGPKFGAEKLNFIQGLDLFVVPSLSEGFSVSAVEALAMEVPLLVTRTSNVGYFFDTESFFMCEPTVCGLERGLQQALRCRDKWLEMTLRGRALVEDRLNWNSIAGEMLSAYAKICEDGR